MHYPYRIPYMFILALFLIISSYGMGLSNAAGTAEAYLGQPFGVGRVTIDVLQGESVLPLQDDRFTLIQAQGRTFYPLLKSDNAGKLLRNLLNINTPRSISIYFLFKGNESFDISVFTPNEQGIRVSPRENTSAHTRLMNDWWNQLTGHLMGLEKDPTYPPIAENFLVGTMSRRLSREIPAPKAGLFSLNKKKNSVMNEVLLSEGFQRKFDRKILSAEDQIDIASLPIASAPNWKPATNFESEDVIETEQIASYVPEECFYLRFGNFTNYLWFRDLNKKWQGDLGNMIMRRGILKGSSERLQQQLSLKENALAKILGPQVIADAAIIGLDPYVNHGAAIGILFKAKNNFLLEQDLMKQRRSAIKNFADAKESTIRLQNQDVSLIATADGKVRSYYAKKDDYHLVSTSSTLVQRFLEAGNGMRPLSDLSSFKKARSQIPINREDLLFAYIPAKFFQNLCSPQYRIETLRRLESHRLPFLIELARYSAQAEGIPAHSYDQLVESDILPSSFLRAFEKNQFSENGEEFIDPVRGAIGYFLPVADVFVPEISQAENLDYQQFIKRFRSEIGQMPPIAIGIQRDKHDTRDEDSIRLDVWVNDLAHCKLNALADSLGKPSRNALQPITGDLISAEAVLDIPVPLIGGEKQPHHLFGGIRDFRTPLIVEKGDVEPSATFSEFVRGYVGAWPKPGILQLFGANTKQDSDPIPLGDQLWQAKQDEFLLISFKPDVVKQVLPQLNIIQEENSAQVRVRVEDLSGSQLSQAINSLGYMRARETSMAASRLMNSFANLLQVPRPLCREFAEKQMDGKFICALGGEYELFSSEFGLEVWLSSALPSENRFLLTEVPKDYQLALLDWFRGFKGELEVTENELRLHLDIKITKSALPW